MTSSVQSTTHGIEHLPITLFTSVMGLGGFTLATEQLENIAGVSGMFSFWLLMLTSVVWIVVVVSYLTKWVKYPHRVTAELNHPIRLSFFPASSIGLILIAAGTYEYSSGTAEVLWWVAIAVQLFFTLMILNRWIHREHFTTEHNSPAWFIPIVANLLVPITGAQLGYTDISYFFFAFGIVFWLPLMAISLNRSFFFSPIPQKLLPTLFILIVPPSIGFTAWTALHGGQLDDFGRILYFTGLFMTLMVVTQAKKFMRLPFALSWWAFSFPLASITIASFVYFALVQNEFFLVLAISLYVVLTGVILVLIVRTLVALMQRRLLVAEE